MPFKSRAQHRLFRLLERRGELDPGTTAAWLAETHAGLAKLPETVAARRKTAELPAMARAQNHRVAVTKTPGMAARIQNTLPRGGGVQMPIDPTKMRIAGPAPAPQPPPLPGPVATAFPALVGVGTQRLGSAPGTQPAPASPGLPKTQMVIDPSRAVPGKRAAVSCRKLAWEFEDDTGLHSNHPLRYVSEYVPPPTERRVGVPPSHPEYDQKFVAAAIDAALKKMPANHKLHWIDPAAVVGRRAWYNPARYVAGRDIIGDQEHTLDATSNEDARAQIVTALTPPGGAESKYEAFLPARYLDDIYGPVTVSPGLPKTQMVVDPAATPVRKSATVGILPMARQQ